MEAFGILRRDRQGKQGGGVMLYKMESFDKITLTVSDDVVEILCARIRRMENKGGVVVSVYY